jgi:hypothetical protein
MFPIIDARTVLQVTEQRADDLRREAAADRLARSVTPPGRHRRFRFRTRRPQGVRAPVLP